jgi:predicted nucleic acid-binding protein
MIFLDTSFIVSFYNTRDENHQKAVKLMQDINKEKYGSMLISDYIFDETITVIFTRTRSLSKTIGIGEYLRKFGEMIEIGKVLFEDAWNTFKSQEKTSLSFTDCTSLAVMKAEDIRNIATFDDDFKKIRWINVIE